MNKHEANIQSFSLENKISESTKLAEILNIFFIEIDIASDTCNDMRLAAEETFINIVNYAYTDNNPHTIKIKLSNTTNTLSITFIDQGIAFNPLLSSSDCNDSNKDINDYCEGGMGLQLIKTLTDRQEYNRINNRNVFTITKHYTERNNKTENRSPLCP